MYLGTLRHKADIVVYSCMVIAHRTDADDERDFDSDRMMQSHPPVGRMATTMGNLCIVN